MQGKRTEAGQKMDRRFTCKLKLKCPKATAAKKNAGRTGERDGRKESFFKELLSKTAVSE
jgi:hypothetical protein